MYIYYRTNAESYIIFAEDSGKINHFLSLGKHFIDIFACSKRHVSAITYS